MCDDPGVTGARARWAALLVGAGAVAGAAGLSSAAARPSLARGCPRPTIPVPPNEPVYTAGRTVVVTGLYIQGGPLPPPPCKPKPRGPYAGTVTVSNPRTGATVATQRVPAGHLAHIHLAPGSYRLSGQLSGGGRATTAPTVRIRRGYRTRQDLFEDVP